MGEMRTFFATAIFTGMRAGELAGLHWDDVDFDRRLISVQRSYDGPTKNGEVRHVPILDPLLPILREWRVRSPGRLVLLAATEIRVNLAATSVGRDLGQASAAAVAS